MSPIAFLTLCVVTIIALVGMNQIKLVQDVISSTGYSSGEVLAGIGTIMILFYVLVAIFTMEA